MRSSSRISVYLSAAAGLCSIPEQISGFQGISIIGQHHPVAVDVKTRIVSSILHSSRHSFVEGESFDDELDEIAAMGGDPFFLGSGAQGNNHDDVDNNRVVSEQAPDDDEYLWDGQVIEDAHLDFVDRVPLPKVSHPAANNDEENPGDYDVTSVDGDQFNNILNVIGKGSISAAPRSSTITKSDIKVDDSSEWEWDVNINEDAHLEDEIIDNNDDDDDENDMIGSENLAMLKEDDDILLGPKISTKKDIIQKDNSEWEWDGTINEDAHLEDELFDGDDDSNNVGFFPTSPSSSLLSSMATSPIDIESLPSRITQRRSLSRQHDETKHNNRLEMDTDAASTATTDSDDVTEEDILEMGGDPFFLEGEEENMPANTEGSGSPAMKITNDSGEDGDDSAAAGGASFVDEQQAAALEEMGGDPFFLSDDNDIV